MIEIQPNALYSRSDLAAMLEGSGVDVDTFIARIKARKVFRMLWLGEDLLAAIRSAPALSDRSDSAELPEPRRRGGWSTRRLKDQERPGAAIRREFIERRDKQT
jgi:hypothetical protein